MIIRALQQDQIDPLWHLVEPLLRLAVDVTPDKLSTDDVLQQTHEGVYGIWVIIDEKNKDIVAAAATRIGEYPKGNALCVDFVGGKRMREWLPDFAERMREHAKHNNCKWLEGYGRRAWERWLKPHGWKPKMTIYEMEL